MGRKPKDSNENPENINENDTPDDDNNPEVGQDELTNKEGKKVTKKRTLKAAQEGAKIVEKQLAPTSNNPRDYQVLSNLKHNGDFYSKGDVLASKPCKAMDDLVKAGVVK